MRNIVSCSVNKKFKEQIWRQKGRQKSLRSRAVKTALVCGIQWLEDDLLSTPQQLSAGLQADQMKVLLNAMTGMSRMVASTVDTVVERVLERIDQRFARLEARWPSRTDWSYIPEKLKSAREGGYRIRKSRKQFAACITHRGIIIQVKGYCHLTIWM
ncbi:uncharacterized protein PAE49_006460 [Odontesthes bonariensis]